jgi:hypothetical protein
MSLLLAKLSLLHLSTTITHKPSEGLRPRVGSNTAFAGVGTNGRECEYACASTCVHVTLIDEGG